MADPQVLEAIVKRGQDEKIIAQLARLRGISLPEAMEQYYSSDLAEQIYDGAYGIHYLDYQVLTEILLERGKRKSPSAQRS